MRKLITVLTLTTLLSPVVALAQTNYSETRTWSGAPVDNRDVHRRQGGYQGPSRVTKVADLSRFQSDDQDVILEGYIINRIGKDDYTFKDDTGSIAIELDDDIRLVNINEHTKVRIYGEYDGGFDNRVDVDRVEVMPARVSAR